MPSKHALPAVAVLLGLALSSCSIARQAVIRNASDATLTLWPLGAQPQALNAGEVTQPIIYDANERQEAMIQRGNCLYTYPAPDYFALPKELKGLSPRVVVVIDRDMMLHVHQRSKDGVEGSEILAAGFPLKPTAFCGTAAS